MNRALAFLIGFALAAPAGATSYMPVHVITKEDMREAARRRREEQAFCRKARKAMGRIEKLGSLKKYDSTRKMEFAWLLERGEEGCPQDLDLAIAIVEPLVDTRYFYMDSSSIMQRLFDLLNRRGRPDDLARAAELHRYLWVRGSYAVKEPPNWSDPERRSFVAREEVWKLVGAAADGTSRAYQLHVEALLDPLSPRFDPAAGVSLLELQPGVEGPLKAARILLDGKLLPVDRPRAEGLLWRIAGHTDEATLLLIDLYQVELASKDPAVRRPLVFRLLPFVVDRNYPKSAALRARFAPFLIPDLTDPDPRVQAGGAAQLAILGRQGTEAAVPPLLAWIEPRLASRDKATADQAREILKSLVMDGVGPARAVMDREYARMGGLVEAGDWSPDLAKPVPMEKVILSFDYPTRAIREERTGVVRAEAVFGPDGKVFMIAITGSSGSPDLDRTVQSTLQRRMRRSWPEWPGRYVRVKLPPIQFRISGCDDEPPPPAVEGATLVDGVRYCRQPDVTPIVLN